MMLTALFLAGALRGDPTPHSTAHAGDAGAIRMYDLAAVLPYHDEMPVSESLLPYLEGGNPESSLAYPPKPLHGADVVLELFRNLNRQEFDYEGRELRIDDRGRLLVKGPLSLLERTERYLSALESLASQSTELTIDVVVLPASKDTAYPAIVPAADIAKYMGPADAGGRHATYKLGLRPDVVARLDLTHGTRMVTDYDIEIAEAANILDPVVEEVPSGMRLSARVAPAPGGSFLALILRDGEPLGDVVNHDLSLNGLISTQDKLTYPEGPHAWQSLSVLNRSLSLNTFIPDGKALLLQADIDLHGTRQSRIIILRQTGKALPISQPCTLDPKSGTKTPDAIFVNTQSAMPPRSVLSYQMQVEGPGRNMWSARRSEGSTLLAGFTADAPDPIYELWRTNDERTRIDSLGAWAFLSMDPDVPPPDAEAAAKIEDPLALLGRYAPVARVFQVTIALRREGSLVARWMLPARQGVECGAVLGTEDNELIDYDVEVAQHSSGSDPVMKRVFDGLIVSFKPDISPSGEMHLDLDASARVRKGDVRELDVHAPTLGKMQQSTFDQIAVRERLSFGKGEGATRRVTLGDAASHNGSGTLSLEVEMVEAR